MSSDRDPLPGGAPGHARTWEDPRTGIPWKVLRLEGPAPGEAGASTIVFEGEAGRFWAAYAGGKGLPEMDDTDLILLYDSTMSVTE